VIAEKGISKLCQRDVDVFKKRFSLINCLEKGGRKRRFSTQLNGSELRNALLICAKYSLGALLRASICNAS
jgi:hypothetical protein